MKNIERKNSCTIVVQYQRQILINIEYLKRRADHNLKLISNGNNMFVREQ